VEAVQKLSLLGFSRGEVDLLDRAESFGAGR